MRRIAVIAVALLTVTSVVAAPASAGKGKKQKVEGAILLPAPFAGDPSSCFSGLHRRFAIATQEQVNGVFGFHFDLDKKTWNQNFVLEVNDGLGDVDLDITFYSEFGTPEQAADPGFAPPNISFDERSPGGEAGVVPKGMNKAIVCMWSGDQHQGAFGSFTYTAGKGVKLPQE